MSYQVSTMNSIEIGIALENFHRNSKGKWYIPSLMPKLSSSRPYITSVSGPSTSRIINKPSLPISSVNTSNYVELKVQEYVADALPKVPLTNEQIIQKGARVQIMFTGGDLTSPAVIGAVV